MDDIVDVVKNMAINDAVYELNTSTISDARGDLISDPDTVTHTSNRILEQKLSSFRTII